MEVLFKLTILFRNINGKNAIEKAYWINTEPFHLR